MSRRVLTYLLWFSLMTLRLSATTPVTGSLKDLGTGTVTKSAKVRLWLRGCNGNQPRVNSVALIAPTAGTSFFKDFVPDVTGLMTGTVYSNDVNIECGGAVNVTWYGVQVYVNGVPGPEMPVKALDGVSLNITSVTPLTVTPVITPPTGDSTYARLDAGNQPFTAAIQSPIIFKLSEGVCPAGVTGLDLLCADSVSHLLKVSENGGTFGSLPIAFSPITNTVVKFNSSGNLVNSSVTDDGTFVSIAEDTKYTSLNNKALISVAKAGTWAAALTLCPASGCTLDGTSQDTPLAIGTFDPGNKAVKILLGPYSYTMVQLVLETNLHLIGVGSSNHTGHGFTKITSVGANGTPLITIPQASSTPAQNVRLEGVNFVGASGNTSQQGFFPDAGSASFTLFGLWGGTFEDLVFSGFLGNAIHLKGHVGDVSGVDQFLTFKDVHAFRATGGLEALRIDNGVGQIKFISCQFDGPAITDSTAPNIFIGELNGGDTSSPYTIDFDMTTIQASHLGVQLSGVQGVVFRHSHLEGLHGWVQLSLVGTTANYGVVLDSNDIFGTVGVNAGAGFIVKDNNGQSRIKFTNNLVEGAPDHIITGAQLATYAIHDNSQTNSPPAWTSTNVTPVLTPAATLNVQDYRAIDLSASATVITTLQSALGPGEILTVRATGSTVSLGTGGNISLGTYTSPLVLSVGETATFTFDDNAGSWVLTSTSSNRATCTFTSTSRTTALGATTVCTTPAVDAMYLLMISVQCRSASAAATATPTLTITDISNTSQPLAAGAATCTTLGANSITQFSTPQQIKASTAIQVSVVIANTPTYDLRVAVIKVNPN